MLSTTSMPLTTWAKGEKPMPSRLELSRKLMNICVVRLFLPEVANDTKLCVPSACQRVEAERGNTQHAGDGDAVRMRACASTLRACVRPCAEARVTGIACQRPSCCSP